MGNTIRHLYDVIFSICFRNLSVKSLFTFFCVFLCTYRGLINFKNYLLHFFMYAIRLFLLDCTFHEELFFPTFDHRFIKIFTGSLLVFSFPVKCFLLPEKLVSFTTGSLDHTTHSPSDTFYYHLYT